MATYNGEKYLKEQIESILHQVRIPGHDFEIVICDDNSNDSTREILQDFEQKYPIIRCYYNDTNIGFLSNFNKAISLCKGEYIALSDQDDIWLPNHIKILYEGIKMKDCDDTYDLCGANAILVDSNNQELGTSMLESMSLNYLPKTQDEYKLKIIHGNFFQGAACMITRRLANRALPVPENVAYHDHWLALYACFLNGIIYIDETVLRYRQHEHNVTGKGKKFSISGEVKSTITREVGMENKGNDNRTDNMIQQLYINPLVEILKIPEVQANTKDEKNIYSAIDYYERLKRGCPYSILAIPYFCKHYYEIYLNKDKKLFLFRLVKRIMGWI